MMMRRRTVLACASLLMMATGCPDSEPPTNNVRPDLVVERDGDLIDITAAISIEEGTSIELDASASTDPDGDTLSFSWTVEGPDGSELATGDSAAFSFTFAEMGTYVVGVSVSDGSLTANGRVTVTVTPATVIENQAPTADAGPDANVAVGTLTTLDASASSDPDGDDLSYSWTIDSSPEGSNPALTDADVASPEFTPTAAGDYTFTVTVDDGNGGTDSDSVTVTAAAEANLDPLADAGPDQTVTVGDLVTLDASASSDPNGDALAFTWSIATAPNGSAANLSATDVASPEFTPDLEGTYTLMLMVSDGNGGVATDSVTVTAEPIPNQDPVADAGADLTGNQGQPVVFDASASSDPDGDALTYAWAVTTAPGGSAATLDDASASAPTLTPDLPGTFTLTLTVDDGRGSTATDTVDLVVNGAPVADAGADQPAILGDAVTLDGSGTTDPEGDAFTYQWTVTNQPAGSLVGFDDATSANPTFTPPLAGTYTVELAATDDDGAIGTDTVVVTVTADQPPTAVISASAGNVQVGGSIVFDGSGSTDPEDGAVSSYQWILSSAPAGSTAAPSTAIGDTTTLVTDVPGDYTVTLNVTDSRGALGTATETITADPLPNTTPVANAGADQLGNVSDSITLDASGSSDADSDPLAYAWAITSAPTGSTATLSDDTAEAPNFTADVPGDFTFTLTVDDGRGGADTDTVTVSVNAPPVADAGADFSGNQGDTVSLDASTGSSDPDNDTLTYAWAITTAPGGSSAALTSTDTAATGLTFDVGGTYVLTVTVDDGRGATASDTVTITVNGAPVADAGSDDTAVLGNALSIDASGSTDPENDALTYGWAVTTAPAGSTATPADVSAAQTTFTGDVSGTYVLTLTVSDPNGLSDTDTVTLGFSEPANQPPVADAGSGSTVVTGQPASIDGSASTDPDSDPLTYTWSVSGQPLGSTGGAFADASAAATTFTPDIPGDFELTLTIDDGRGGVDSASITVTSDGTPTADADADDEDINLGATVTLDASASSDPESGAITYSWAITAAPAGSTAALSDPSAESPTITPDVRGDFTFTVTVSDGRSDASDSVTVSVNGLPIANAGADATVLDGATANLDGSSSSDPEGASLSYSWAVTSAPAGSLATLAGSTTATPEITPDVAGDYVITLTVDDGNGATATDAVTITLDGAPVADAGSDQTVDQGDTVNLDGTNSSDPENGALTYLWALTPPTNSGASLSDDTAASPSFIADLGGTYTVELLVSDAAGNTSAVDSVTVFANANQAPTANAGADQTVTAGDTVNLDGSGSTDPENDVITYLWDLTPPAGSTATLSDDTAETPSFTADLAGDYTVDLIVEDSFGNTSAADSVTITADPANQAPTADAGADQAVNTGATVNLDGTGSSDPENDALTYLWDLTPPAGSSATLSDDSSATPSFTADIAGTYTADLIVDDGNGGTSAVDSVTITVTDAAEQPPVADAGADQIVASGATVNLDGTNSSDPEGTTLSYLWDLTAPTTSTAALSDDTSGTPSFTADVPGLYVIDLLVEDGASLTDIDSVEVFVTSANCTSGLIISQYVEGSSNNKAIEIHNCSASTTFDMANFDLCRFTNGGTTCTSLGVDDYAATLAPGETLALCNGSAVQALRDLCDATDGGVTHSGNDGYIIYEDVNTSGGYDAGDTILDAFGQIGDGSNFAQNDTFDRCDFRPYDGSSPFDPTNRHAALGQDTYDGIGQPPAENCFNASNQAPTADAGADQSGTTNVIVNLDGTGSSDPENDALSYLWALSGPMGSSAALDDDSSATPSFTPDLAGTYTVELLVSDTNGNTSAVDSVTITVAQGANQAPTANAGSNRTVNTGSLVTLDGTGSTDPENDPLTYLWGLTPPAGSSAMLSDDTASMPTFTPDVDGDYTVELLVDDGNLSSAVVTITITASTPSGTFPGCTDGLFISEYIEEGNDKALEIFNCGSATVNLDDFEICTTANGSTVTCEGTIAFTSGTMLAAGDFWVLSKNNADASILAVADQTSGSLQFNGNDRVGIRRKSDQVIVDAIGELIDSNPPNFGENVALQRCDYTAYSGSGAYTVSDYFETAASVDASNLGLQSTICP